VPAVHDHSEILALGAAAIDFELDPGERAMLDEALETCVLCRRQVASMRATATVLRRPSDIGTPARVRDVVVGAALRGGRRGTSALRPLLVASLSLLVVAGGAAVLVGGRGLGLALPVGSPAATPSESAAALASTSAMPEATASVSPTPTPTLTAPAVVATPPLDGPLRAGEVAAMVTDGRLVIRTLPKTAPDSAIFKTRIYPGQRMLTLEGPIEADGYPWFRIRLGVVEGWVAAAGLDGEPWLEPVRDGVIAFVRDGGPGLGEALYTIGADGATGERVLLEDPNLTHYDQLTWSPDGRHLAFVGTPADSTNGSTEIYTIDAAGSNLVRITQNEVNDDSPAWSPDSTRLALRVDQVDLALPGGSNVVVTPIDGPGVTILGPGANPAWSPDGLLIAMTVPDADANQLWVQAPDGGGRRRVADLPVVSTPPTWSPDGQQLVVASSGLSIVDVASGSITSLTGQQGSTPTWSIAGTIAFETTDSTSPGAYVVDPDGSSLRNVSGVTKVVGIPRWAPDGRRLVLGDGDASGVAVVDPSNGNVTILDNTTGTTRSPAWQPILP
jgi:anti-sigma factor RsiW